MYDAYLEQMGGEMDSRYAAPDGRKTVYASLNPVELLKSPNQFTIIALVVILVVLAVLVLVVRLVVRRVRRGGQSRRR